MTRNGIGHSSAVLFDGILTPIFPLRRAPGFQLRGFVKNVTNSSQGRLVSYLTTFNIVQRLMIFPFVSLSRVG